MKTLVFSALAVIGMSFAAGAQDRLTYDFEGRIGLGWLDSETVDGRPAGFRYQGYVLRAEGNGRLDVPFGDRFHFGVVARASLKRGQQTNYDKVSPVGISVNSGAKFDDADVDLAFYVAAQAVTFSYGEMETAFDFATLEIEHGGSILDGGSAVWLNIGDGAGSLAYRNQPGSAGPSERTDYATLRADVELGDFRLSASTSSATSITSFLDAPTSVESVGLMWQREVKDGSIFVGGGHERGPVDTFDSVSLGFKIDGVNFVVSRIHRTPLVLTGDPRGVPAAYDTTFFGSSISYDFGRYTLGVAIANQGINPLGDPVFEGQARALWGSWQVTQSVSAHFEVSESNYPYGGDFGGGDDARMASFAVALEF
jgi:hypothetical protein